LECQDQLAFPVHEGHQVHRVKAESGQMDNKDHQAKEDIPVLEASKVLLGLLVLASSVLR
jgi:hypothetical protein